MESFDNGTSPLLSSVSDEKRNVRHTKVKMYGYWERRKEAWTKRKRQASSPCRLGFSCLILLWSVLALATTILSYFRLVTLLQSGYDKFTNEKNRYPSLYPLWRETNKNSSKSAEESLSHSNDLASMGAYLIMTTLLLSIILVFSFICLPFDLDKMRLRLRLKRWLCVYLGFIALVAFFSLMGVTLVLIHDAEKNQKILCVNSHSRYFFESCYWEGIIWSCTLIITPFVVLAYHVYFWRSVYLIYDAIDMSKTIIKCDVWSYKV